MTRCLSFALTDASNIDSFSEGTGPLPCVLLES